MCPLKFGSDITDVAHFQTSYMKKCCKNMYVPWVIENTCNMGKLPSFFVSIVIGVLVL